MTDELKSCPFCGGKAALHRPSIAVYAICSRCGISTSYIYPPEEAVRRWNNRSAEDALQERIAKLEKQHKVDEERLLMRDTIISRLQAKLDLALADPDGAKARAERDRLREALQEIKHVPCRKEGGMYDSDGDWYVNECSSCRRMHDIAREALKGEGE